MGTDFYTDVIAGEFSIFIFTKDPTSGKIILLTGMGEDARDTVLGILKQGI